MTEPATTPEPECTPIGRDLTLLCEAVALVVGENHGSVSFVQRKVQVGFATAFRLLDLMEERGIVGPAIGSRARTVLAEPADVGRILSGLALEAGGGQPYIHEPALTLADRLVAAVRASGGRISSADLVDQVARATRTDRGIIRSEMLGHDELRYHADAHVTLWADEPAPEPAGGELYPSGEALSLFQAARAQAARYNTQTVEISRKLAESVNRVIADLGIALVTRNLEAENGVRVLAGYIDQETDYPALIAEIRRRADPDSTEPATGVTKLDTARAKLAELETEAKRLEQLVAAHIAAGDASPDAHRAVRDQGMVIAKVHGARAILDILEGTT